MVVSVATTHPTGWVVASVGACGVVLNSGRRLLALRQVCAGEHLSMRAGGRLGARLGGANTTTSVFHLQKGSFWKPIRAVLKAGFSSSISNEWAIAEYATGPRVSVRDRESNGVWLGSCNDGGCYAPPSSLLVSSVTQNLPRT